jgi:hypothetical protein
VTPHDREVPSVEQTRLDPSDAGLLRVSLDDATPLERRWLEDRLAGLRAGNNVSRGTFAEVVVADALPGAELTAPWSPHDLVWEGLTIQVKCSSAYQLWHDDETTPSPAKWECRPTTRDIIENGRWETKGPSRWSIMWVFARHEGRIVDGGWTFRVVPRWWLDKHGSQSVTPGVLRYFPAVETRRLVDTIRSTPLRDPQFSLFEALDDPLVSPDLVAKPMEPPTDDLGFAFEVE